MPQRKVNRSRCEAIVLLGPTGAGKTPLGAWLEAKGLWGRRCLHFDFGASLRERAGKGAGPGPLTPAQRRFLVAVLTRGALLEDRHFPIARRLLEDFLRKRRARSRSPMA